MRLRGVERNGYAHAHTLVHTRACVHTRSIDGLTRSLFQMAAAYRRSSPAEVLKWLDKLLIKAISAQTHIAFCATPERHL
eukprot:4025955-Pleurochrysis_carterae.AAC.1